LTGFVNANNTIITKGLSGNKDKSICDSLSVKKDRVSNFINVNVAKLGYYKYNSILLDGLHKDRKISLNIRWHLYFNTTSEFLLIGSRVPDFHEVTSLDSLGSFLFTEAEKVVFVRIVVSDW